MTSQPQQKPLTYFEQRWREGYNFATTLIVALELREARGIQKEIRAKNDIEMTPFDEGFLSSMEAHLP